MSNIRIFGLEYLSWPYRIRIRVSRYLSNPNRGFRRRIFEMPITAFNLRERMFSKVVFPQPEGPMTANISPTISPVSLIKIPDLRNPLTLRKISFLPDFVLTEYEIPCHPKVNFNSSFVVLDSKSPAISNFVG